MAASLPSDPVQAAYIAHVQEVAADKARKLLQGTRLQPGPRSPLHQAPPPAPASAAAAAAPAASFPRGRSPYKQLFPPPAPVSSAPFSNTKPPSAPASGASTPVAKAGAGALLGGRPVPASILAASLAAATAATSGGKPARPAGGGTPRLTADIATPIAAPSAALSAAASEAPRPRPGSALASILAARRADATAAVVAGLQARRLLDDGSRLGGTPAVAPGVAAGGPPPALVQRLRVPESLPSAQRQLHPHYQQQQQQQRTPPRPHAPPARSPAGTPELERQTIEFFVGKVSSWGALHRLFAAWHTVAAQRAARRRTGDAAAARLARRRLAAAWVTWQEAHRAAVRRAGLKLEMAAAHRRGRQLSAAMQVCLARRRHACWQNMIFTAHAGRCYYCYLLLQRHAEPMHLNAD